MTALKPKQHSAPTVEEIQSDVLTEYAAQYWAPHSKGVHSSFDAKIIEKIYFKELLPSKFQVRRIMLLEFSQYLECYLWPNFDEQKSSKGHVMSICMMVNEKFREKVPMWEAFKSDPANFPGLIRRVMKLNIDDTGEISIKEQTIALIFLTHCFNSLEVDLIREEIQKLISLRIWSCILPGRLEQELKIFPKYRKFWNLMKKKESQMDEAALKRVNEEKQFLSDLIKLFFKILDTVPALGSFDKDIKAYCERFVELIIDLLSMLPTRRFVNVLLDDHHLVVRCKLSNIAKREKEGHLFNQLVDALNFYSRFEINEHTGTALTDHEMSSLHCEKITSLQRAAFKHLRDDLLDFCMGNVASVDKRESLTKLLGVLSKKKLHTLAEHLKLVPERKSVPKDVSFGKSFLLELLVSRHQKRQSQIEVLNGTPYYPTEEILWDENIVPSEYYSGNECLALPKLNLQFLTLHDYLLRNHNLFQLESTYEIREDIADAVSRLRPWKNEVGKTEFGGWARMAKPITDFSVVQVGKPNISESRPSVVKADVTLTLSMQRMIRNEWEALRKHDVGFLIGIDAVRKTPSVKYDKKIPFKEQFGVKFIRGCEIEGLLDEDGNVIEEGPDAKPLPKGDVRTYRVWLDTNQYKIDLERTAKGMEDVYESFNVFMRRKPKENNFKAVLETIRDLMNTECLVPEWIHDVFLGYDDPAAANHSRLSSQISSLDFCDTFLNFEHLKQCFPGRKVQCSADDAKLRIPPFRLAFSQSSERGKRKAGEESPVKSEDEVMVEPYVIPNRGPYPYNKPKMNSVPFTPTQIEAIHSGMQPGLTMVVGPPGTGKTDVAVQIISNIYHNFPSQRTLIVTHSNQALNQIFEKIMALDIDERHLLRLGHGEEMLETEKDFSRYGRVNYVLARRLDLLKEVQRLQESLGVTGDVSYTCETAGHFYLYQVISRWEEYQSKLKKRSKDLNAIREEFPFAKFFENAPQPIFKGGCYEEDLEIAEGCFRHLKKIFTELEEYRAFELLRSGRDRSKYLLIKTAKIIAMTCTHAALRRRDLVELNFKYDNVLMEEAAQILEIETFIPLMLQNPEDGLNRLKRIILIGDHHQLPPVIKNMAFQKFSNMEQSLFTRFVRLGVPYVELDAQGRARPSLCALYSWRYNHLGDLPHVIRTKEYQLANPGFVYDFQLIDVGDFNGVGETEPTPYFYQNLAEAEYCVALFMYMRLLGYPASKISILTTYNGQKHLIRDVIKQRCGDNPLIGKPHKVTTVDRYQGQQNDYVIISLVRTRAVGHLRDVRRLIVAMSRARLGLYIFARVSLFRNCYELSPAFNQLCARPQKLFLAPWESYSTARPNDKPPQGQFFVSEDMPHLAKFVFDIYGERIQDIQAKRNIEHKMEVVEEVKKTTQESKESRKDEKDEKEEYIINEVIMEAKSTK
ncbi:RNA helicase aquarius-like [Rhopilema esculentum]|uniref:RNA helicase aquarius-like n=1 Tax=Rhopilema esculentum TaxID=499914 RepID=UPI0031D179EB